MSSTERARAEATDLLFEVPPVLLVDEDEVEVVPYAELLVHLAESRRELEPAKEESNRDDFACSSYFLFSNVKRKLEQRRYMPLTGAPSMISNLTMVSLSLY